MKKCSHTDSLRSGLRPGRFYKLLNPVGPIPAGIYRYEDWSEGSAIFSVSSDRATFFGLSGLDGCMISEVPYSRGRRARVRPLEFASHYFKYLAQEAKHLCDCECSNDGNAFADESPKTPQLTICSIPLTSAILSDRSIMEQMFEVERQMPEGPHYLTSEILHSQLEFSIKLRNERVETADSSGWNSEFKNLFLWPNRSEIHSGLKVNF